MTLTVQYSGRQPPLVACVTASLTGLVVSFKPGKSTDKAPVLTDSEVGFTISGDFAIARYLVRKSGKVALLGTDAMQSSEVDQFLDFFQAVFPLDVSSGAQALDAALLHRTYLAGFSLTLADVAAAVALAGAAGAGQGLSALARYSALIASHVPVKACEALQVTEAAPAAAAGAAAAAAPKSGKGGKKAAGGKEAAGGKGGKGDKGGKQTQTKGGKGGAPAGGSGGGKKGGGKGGKAKKLPPIVVSKQVTMPALPDAVEGQVVTRFPPEPSGYLHVGHIKAAMLNNFYARHYKGKLLLRFDDTNPRKERAEFEEAIIEDLSTLGIVPDMVSHTSDFFPLIITYARKMLHEGNAYMDDSTSDAMFEQRKTFQPSPRRETPVHENLARFEDMLNKVEEGRGWCMRAKLDYQSKNKCCMDPVMFRHVEEPHNRTGTTYKAYPTYDFACPIVDAVEGVTHAMRTTEYKDRDEQYAWIARLLGVREVHVVEFARMNFQFTALSKRQLNKLVDDEMVSGWDDPRFPTVRAVMRRGVSLDALRTFILSQGASKRITDMEWDKLWATNKKVIDKVCPRFTAVSDEGKVMLQLQGEGVPSAAAYRTVPLHPKNADVGTKSVPFTSTVWLERDDADMLAAAEEVTLMKWCNAIVESIEKDPAGNVTAVKATLNPSGDVRSTSKKLTWVPAVPTTVPLTLREFDVLLTAERLEEGQDISTVFNTASIADTQAVGEPALSSVKAGDILQLERRGYFRVDTPPKVLHDGSFAPALLFNIPSGKEKAMSKLSNALTRTDHATVEARRAAATAKRLAAGGGDKKEKKEKKEKKGGK